MAEPLLRARDIKFIRRRITSRLQVHRRNQAPSPSFDLMPSFLVDTGGTLFYLQQGSLDSGTIYVDWPMTDCYLSISCHLRRQRTPKRQKPVGQQQQQSRNAAIRYALSLPDIYSAAIRFFQQSLGDERPTTDQAMPPFKVKNCQEIYFETTN
ncbi:hypothetical protein DAPPUDRAFT_249242 [Daphnia pulex]|uniref:Uncharacterized protein n=1 Tax=Daphnia pulex TaxID=6669 RepID=E9GW83_DAPPU|nr:hypothetical protein DAPPUDRAFT_249242 [Daphnia pulex]|eukprot:EFX76303.1 hypothetical protein DAPPUDRAFT_249242 [Daphnia pulex]